MARLEHTDVKFTHAHRRAYKHTPMLYQQDPILSANYLETTVPKPVLLQFSHYRTAVMLFTEMQEKISH